MDHPVVLLPTIRTLHDFSKQGRNVAILVHEFPDTTASYSSGGCGNSKVTITLNGRATIQVRRGTLGKGGDSGRA